MSDSEIIKVTLNLYRSDITALEELSDLTGLNKTESLRRAVATDLYLRKAVTSGTQILCEIQMES